MVDFRYHLISLIAVILALALGILAGSGFLGGPILEQLEEDVSDLASENDRLQGEIDRRETQLDQAQEFALQAEPFLTRGELSGEEIVVFQFEGSENRVAEGVKTQLVDAGAEIVTEITLSPKLALESAPARDELALIAGSLESTVGAILEDAGQIIGARAAAAAADRTQTESPSGNVSLQRFEAVIDELENAEFISASTVDGQPMIPAAATFVIVGGSPGRPPFETRFLIPALAENLTGGGAPGVVVEGSNSTWGLVRSVRADVEARASTVTVDNGESTMGRIALVLGIDEARRGDFGHYGTQPGSDAIIPGPVPSD
jgi:Copper transport outer membrane protein, MctB